MSDCEKEVLAIKKQIAEIQSLDAQALKERHIRSWLPLATISFILGALIAAVAYIIGKIS